MQDLTFITGNENKARYLALWLGSDIPHHSLELDEIQSLDPEEVVGHKVRQAYEAMHRPVLVEDVSLTFTAMGRLPGTLIKWFLEEVGPEGLCKIADTLEHRRAIAQVTYGLYDGTDIHFIAGQRPGRIADVPRAFSIDNSWHNAKSWNTIFIPDGSDKAYAEMSDEEMKPFSHRYAAIEQLREYLQSRHR
jgi:inosine triphosphate pyrophosphatase